SSGPATTAALCDPRRRAPGAETGSGSDAAVRVGAGTIGRLGRRIGARLSDRDDRSPEARGRRRQSTGAAEAGGSGAVNSTATSFQDDAAHVLVVDDDRRLRALLRAGLPRRAVRSVGGAAGWALQPALRCFGVEVSWLSGLTVCLWRLFVF